MCMSVTKFMQHEHVNMWTVHERRGLPIAVCMSLLEGLSAALRRAFAAVTDSEASAAS
jgi:hypothetical protein